MRLASVVFSGFVVAALGLCYVAGVLSLPDVLRLGIALIGLAVLLSVEERLPLATDEAAADGPEGLGSLVMGWAHSKDLARRGRYYRDPVTPGVPAVLERTVRIAEGSAVEFHSLLRPRIVALATRRLREAGIDPYDYEAVEVALGKVGASMVDPTADVPYERHAPGTPAGEVVKVLKRLEALR